jgi:transcription-repair coupling factor (superfamily II helicase)
MTADAIKRLDAIDSLEDLGSGFTLATHDLEIRGAGELLGDTQSGQIQEIGFSLYTELLGRAVEAMRSGNDPDLERPLQTGVEISLHVPALLPEDYVPDVHLRLMLYKRIASAKDAGQIRDLQIELIDRFGLLPPAAQNLMRNAAIKRRAATLGIDKIVSSANGGYLDFAAEAHIDPAALVHLVQNESRTFSLQGAQRLRFRTDLDDTEKRYRFVEDLLSRLDGGNHADQALAG